MSWKDQNLLLPDGRILAYRSHGEPRGRPLIFMHGTPGSRCVLSQRDPLVALPDTFIVVPERPGYGRSSFQADRSLRSWAADVRELAESLRLPRYAVAGISGGAPHALACGHYNADQVSAVMMLSSPAPTALLQTTRRMTLGNRLAVWLGRRFPGMLRAAMKSYADRFSKDPQGFLDAVAQQMGGPDRELLLRTQLRQDMIADLEEAYRQGSDAQFIDASLVMTADHWDFDPAAIHVPVHAWHGEFDRLVPATAARALAAAAPDIKLEIVPGAGHLLTECRPVIEAIDQLMGTLPHG